MHLLLKKNKKLLLTILPLVVLNIGLIFNFIFVHMAESQVIDADLICRNVIPTPTDPQTIFIKEKLECLPGCRQKSSGETLFAYYGDDANQWGKYLYGREGAAEIGGNLVVEDASIFGLNGKDNSNYHWLMTTWKEPMGNALGFYESKGDQRIMFGGNLLANNDMFVVGGKIRFTRTDNSMYSLEYREKEMQTVDKELKKIGSLAFNTDVFKILETPVCGECEGVCERENALTDYSFQARIFGALGVLKADEKITYCGQEQTCDGNCCRLLEYKRSSIPDSFVGFKPAQAATECVSPQTKHYKLCSSKPGDYISCNFLENCDCPLQE